MDSLLPMNIALELASIKNKTLLEKKKKYYSKVYGKISNSRIL